MTTDSDKILIAQVNFPDRPLGTYSYRVAENLGLTEVGVRVRVPFGPRRRVGFVTRLYRGPNDERLKDVSDVIDKLPLIPRDILELTHWMADYYLCDWGEALTAAVPSGLKARTNIRYRLSEEGRNVPLIAEESGPAADMWRALKTEDLSVVQIKRRFQEGASLLEKFRRRGWIEGVEQIITAQSPRYDRLWKWSGVIDYSDALDKLPANARRIRRALELLQGEKGMVTQRRISSIETGLTSAFRSLVKRGWITDKLIPRDNRSRIQLGMEETGAVAPVLSRQQESVIGEIREAIRRGGFHSFLLHGVTASGKTLVYLEAIGLALDKGCGVIVMVPEISLTPQLTGRIRRRFGDTVAVTHSGLSLPERQDVWRLVRSGKVQVVVGPRSVVFTPVKNLGLIIIDEEHEESYKQSDPAPRYNGRDTGLYRAKQCGATCLLGSATPDIQSFHKAQSGRWQLLQLPERFSGASQPAIWIVKWGLGGEGTIFCRQLQSRIKDRLTKQEQVILLMNRRGFSTCIRCPKCGDVASCPSCDITLRYHKVGGILTCHYCGFTQRALDQCPNCKGQRLRYSGVGTQQVERELAQLFPHARVVRMDHDTTRRLGAHQEILGKFARKEFDILLGTQMVAKGHDFPGVTLVGILGADMEWLLPDFRSVERAFRLLVQASGRTGRSDSGEVVIQSWNPSHPLLKWVQSHDYESLYRYENSVRQPLNYPPYGRIITIQIQGPDLDRVIEASDVLKERLESSLQNTRILGPAAPTVERIQEQHRRRIMIKLPPRVDRAVRMWKTLIKNLAVEQEKRFSKDKVKFIIDVDPIEI